MWLLDENEQKETGSELGYYSGDDPVGTELEIENVSDSDTSPSATDDKGTALEKQNGYVRGEDIAQFIGVGLRQIQMLTQEGIIKNEKMPYQTAKMYNFLPTIRALIVYYREKANSRTSVKAEKESTPMETALQEAKLQEQDLKVRKLQIQVELDEGKSHPADLIRRVWGNVMETFRMKMYNIPYVSAEKFIGLPDRDTAFEALNIEMRNLGETLVDYDTAHAMTSMVDFDDEDSEDGDLTEYERTVENSIT